MKIGQQVLFSAVHLNTHPGATMKVSMEKKPDKKTGWTSYIVKGEGDEVLAKVAQHNNASEDVFLNVRKAGLTATVPTKRSVLIALPGSFIWRRSTQLIMNGNGENIQPHVSQVTLPTTMTKAQTVTDQAMILGAGLATRFEPVSGDTTGLPKPGVPLVEKDSIIVTLAKHLQKHGIKKIFVNTYYMPEQVKKQLARVRGVQFVYIDEHKPSGTAGGLTKAMLRGMVDMTKPLLVMQGDAVTNADLSDLLNAHKRNGAAITLGVKTMPDEDVNKVGIVTTADGKPGFVTGFKEKPTLQEAGNNRMGSIGFYVLSPEALPWFKKMGTRYVLENQEFDYAKNVFPTALKELPTDKPSPIYAHEVTGYWCDAGNPEDFMSAKAAIYNGFLGFKLPKQPQRYYFEGVDIWPGVDPSTRRAVADGRIMGNVIVAPKP